MNTRMIANPAQTVSPTPSTSNPAAAAGPGEGGESGLDFAGLLGAGLERTTDPAQARETVENKKNSGGDASACDPAALLDSIAAGKANLEFAGLPGTGIGGKTGPAETLETVEISRDATDDASAAAQPVLQPMMPASLVPIDPTAVQATGNDSAAMPVIGRDGALAAGLRPAGGKSMATDEMRSTTDSPHTGDAGNGADTRPVVTAAKTAAIEPANVPALKAELQERRQQTVSQLTTAGGTPGHTGAPSQSTNSTNVVAHVEHLSRPFGSPNWDDGFSNRVVWMARNGVQSAEIHLNPQDLGPIEVKMMMTNDRDAQATASIQFSAAHAATREAIESALPRLREMLLDSGIALGNTTVDARTAGNANGSGDSGRPSNGSTHSDAHAGQTPDPAIPPRPDSPLRRGNGLVDTFA